MTYRLQWIVTGVVMAGGLLVRLVVEPLGVLYAEVPLLCIVMCYTFITD